MICLGTKCEYYYRCYLDMEKPCEKEKGDKQ